MQMIQTRYPALGLLMTLNWDRALYLCTILIALMFGAWIGSL
ncbi:MAG: hypothetical protein ACFB11_17885 [Paracoccaceae bacterium]